MDTLADFRLADDGAGALETLKAAILALEGSRVYNLLSEYRLRYGGPGRERAFQALHQWRGGLPALAEETTLRMLDLLPHHLTAGEKLGLIRRLRLEALERLEPVSVRLTIAHRSDLTALVTQTLQLLRRVGDLEIPACAGGLHGWLSGGDMPGLARIVAETDRLLAARRLAGLIVQITTLFRLRSLARPGSVVHVSARLEIPTATILIGFRDGFWKETRMAETESDQDFLLRLQDLALAQERQAGEMTYVDFVMRTLTPEEQEKLRAVAVAEGLRTEILLRELQVKTLAARADIELTISTAQRLKEQHQESRVVSDHATASGTTRVEITNRTSRLPPWRK